MIEKQYVVCNGERVGTYAIYDMLKDCVSSEVRFKFEIEELCAKLNRLAALEAVCWEIVEDAPLAYKESTGDFYEDGLNDKTWEIAQKLKAVLEEA